MTDKRNHQTNGQKASDIPHIHISEATKTALDIIEKRKRGLLMGLKTCWRKFNRYIGGGIQEGSQYLIAGRSSVGKSALVNLLIKSLFDENTKAKIVVLYFNFEMPSYKQIIRKLSKELALSVDELLSADSPMLDSNYERVLEAQKALANYTIYFVDIPLDIKSIYTKVMEFYQKFPGYHLVNVFDHSRLVMGEANMDEMIKLGKFSKMCMYLKKKLNCSNIIVSQLNRNIESPDRFRTLHEPIASDIFGADSLFQDADVVVVPHRPEMFRLEQYFGYDTKNFIAMHILKNRDGETGFIPFKHDLRINKIEEL